MPNLESIGLGALAGLVAYAVSMALLSGKFASRESCVLRHLSLDKALEELKQELRDIKCILLRQQEDK